jgi:hypothetical protein
MPLTIDQVSAEVGAPEGPAPSAEPAAGAQPPKPSDLRRQREQLERMYQRASRIAAD